MSDQMNKTALQAMKVDELRALVTDTFEQPKDLDFSTMLKDELVEFADANLDTLNAVLTGEEIPQETPEETDDTEEPEDESELSKEELKEFYQAKENRKPNPATDLR